MGEGVGAAIVRWGVVFGDLKGGGEGGEGRKGLRGRVRWKTSLYW